MDLSEGLHTLLMVALVAGLAPLIAGLLPVRVPQVVLLIVGGVLIGPEMLAWAETGTISLLSDVGLGFLFLLAGYELDLDLFNRQPGHRALGAWFITAGLAIAVTGALAATGFVDAFIPVAIGLTTTALGTLLPILRDNGMLRGGSASTSSRPVPSASSSRSWPSRSSWARTGTSWACCPWCSWGCSVSSWPLRPGWPRAAAGSGRS